jgi:ketosteroid isomerase-like protein
LAVRNERELIVTFTAEDRLAVHELLARYIHVIDGDRDSDTFFSLFTDDIVFDGPAGFFEGTEELKKWLGKGESIPGYRHMTMNAFADGDGDDAELHASFITVITSLESGHPTRGDGHSQLYQTGSYHLLARKADGVWRVRRRTVRVFDLQL